jgi:hypothetical protein
MQLDMTLDSLESEQKAIDDSLVELEADKGNALELGEFRERFDTFRERFDAFKFAVNDAKRKLIANC